TRLLGRAHLFLGKTLRWGASWRGGESRSRSAAQRKLKQVTMHAAPKFLALGLAVLALLSSKEGYAKSTHINPSISQTVSYATEISWASSSRSQMSRQQKTLFLLLSRDWRVDATHLRPRISLDLFLDIKIPD